MSVPAEARARLRGCFDELLAAHNEFRAQADRPPILVDEKTARAQQQALVRRVALAQQQALLAVMESLAVLFDLLTAGQPVQRAGVTRPNGRTPPS